MWSSELLWRDERGGCERTGRAYLGHEFRVLEALRRTDHGAAYQDNQRQVPLADQVGDTEDYGSPHFKIRGRNEEICGRLTANILAIPPRSNRHHSKHCSQKPRSSDKADSENRPVGQQLGQLREQDGAANEERVSICFVRGLCDQRRQNLGRFANKSRNCLDSLDQQSR